MRALVELFKEGSLPLLGLSAVVAVALAFLIRSQTSRTKSNSSGAEEEAPPAPPEGCTLDEFIKRYIKAPHQKECNDKHGNIFRVKNPLPGILPAQVWINDISLVRYLTVQCANMYRDPSTFSTRSKPFQVATQAVVGVGVTGLVGEEWRWRKTALLKSFHKSRMLADERGLMEKLIEEGNILLEKLGQAADKNEPVPVDILATRAAVGVVLYFLFGRDLEFDSEDLRESAKTLMEVLGYCLFTPGFSLFKNIPGTKSYQMERNKIKAWGLTDKVLKDEVQRLLDEFEGKVPVHPDRKPGSVIATLIAEEPRFREGGVPSMLTEARVFVEAGFETTAHSLAFAMGMMAERPDLANEMAALGQKVLGSDMKSLTASQMKSAMEEATLVKNFFMESLRLYPLAPSLGGLCTEDVVIKVTGEGDNSTQSYTLAKGSNVFFPNMLLQRHVKNPDEIDPSRWDVKSKEEEPFLHTFQNGAHSCPGKPLSLLEGHVFLLMVATQFEFSFPPGVTSVEYEDNLLLRPKDGMPLVVKRRHA